VEDVHVNIVLRDALAALDAARGGAGAGAGAPPPAPARPNGAGRAARLAADGSSYYCGADLRAVGGAWSGCALCEPVCGGAGFSPAGAAPGGGCACAACHELGAAAGLEPTVAWHADVARAERDKRALEPPIHNSHRGEFRDPAARARYPGGARIRLYCSEGTDGKQCAHFTRTRGSVEASHMSCCGERGRAGAAAPCPVVTAAAAARNHPSHAGVWRNADKEPPELVRADGTTARITAYCSDGTEGPKCAHAPGPHRFSHMS